jgi:outer membrane lipoprotein carrier protein
MNWPRHAFLILLLALSFAAERPAQTGDPAPDLNKRLDDLDRRIAQIKDLTANFEQQKKSALLKKPLTSSGTVKVKGPKVYWDTTKPHRTVMTIDTTEVRIYYPEQKTVEIYPVQGDMATLSSSPLPRMSVIREQFEITEIKPQDIDPAAKPDGLIAIKLTPKNASLKEHIQQVRVLIDAAAAAARRVEITDADGEQTTLTFTNVKTNTGLTDKDVELSVPKGTTESHPLEGGAPKSPRQPGGNK